MKQRLPGPVPGSRFILVKIQKNHRFALKQWFFVVRQKGFEPPTFWFVAKHSIQLSYWRIPQPFPDCLFRISNSTGFVKHNFQIFWVRQRPGRSGSKVSL